MSPTHSQNKGKRGERQVVDILKRHGFQVKRTPNSGALDFKGDLFGLRGFGVEVKYQESLNIWKALKQAEHDTPVAQVPLVCFRRNDSRWYAALSLEDLAGLLEEVVAFREAA